MTDNPFITEQEFPLTNGVFKIHMNTLELNNRATAIQQQLIMSRKLHTVGFAQRKNADTEFLKTLVGDAPKEIELLRQQHYELLTKIAKEDAYVLAIIESNFVNERRGDSVVTVLAPHVGEQVDLTAEMFDDSDLFEQAFLNQELAPAKRNPNIVHEQRLEIYRQLTLRYPASLNQFVLSLVVTAIGKVSKVLKDEDGFQRG